MRTGTPVSLPYLRRITSIPTGYHGDRFGQDLEPAGEYISFHPPEWGTRDEAFGTTRGATGRTWLEYGTVHFSNPYVLEADTTREWKMRLSEAFDGRTGHVLSRRMKAAGYDGVIVVRPGGEVMEMVNLGARKDLLRPLLPDAPTGRRRRSRMGAR